MRFIVVTLCFVGATAVPSWPGDKKAPAKVAPHFKVEVRGTLHVAPKVDVVSPVLAEALTKQPVKTAISVPGMTMYLIFADTKDLAARARMLDGKTVVITGQLRRSYEGPISGLFPARFDDYIQVTALKSAD